MRQPQVEKFPMGFGILDCLRMHGLDPAWRVKFARHQDDDYPVRELLRHGWLELYQRYQTKPVFHKVDAVVAFSGEPAKEARFQGVYRVGRHRPAAEGPTPADCPWAKEWRDHGGFFYDLDRDTRFDHLRDRLVIDWGGSPRNWHQKARNKPVLQIDRPGRRLPPVDDYQAILLTHEQLCGLAKNELAHRDWIAALKAVGGVYLIVATKSGEQYVGSATGVEGLWGRWREYARCGHGGNQLLRALLNRDPAYPGGFTYSVLEVCPKTWQRDKVVAREAFQKRRLGVRAHGLNAN